VKTGWNHKRLGEISEIRYGYTESANSEPIGPRFLRITDIQDEQVCWESVPYCKIEPELLPRFRLEDEDIVFARTGATTGKSFLVSAPPEAVFASYLIRLRALADVRPKYLSYYFRSERYWAAIKDGSAGSAQGGFNASKLADLEIPFPSETEQERIVNILDEAFEGIAAAKANAEKCVQNAQELFDSWMQGQFTAGGKNWVRVRLGETGSSISTGPFGTMLHKADYVDDGIPLVNPMNIVGSKIVPSTRMMVSPSTKKRLENYVLRKRDVVIARRGELGRCAIVTETEEGWLCGTGSFFVRLSTCIDEQYFAALFGSPAFKSVLDQNSIGTTMSNLNHGILNDLELFLPPVQEQRAIITRAGDLVSEIDRFRANSGERINHLDELKQSLLHQAFTGKL
jgi:type I restriction enzyme S subunit